LIKPFLVGKDIKRYESPESDQYLIYIPWHFPLHADTNISGASEIAETTFKKNYPAIYNHLLKYKNLLQNRNAAETGIRYEWYALQRFASYYYEEFEKPKIIVPAIVQSASYTFDTNGLNIRTTRHL